jgi:hypothetical protein
MPRCLPAFLPFSDFFPALFLRFAIANRQERPIVAVCLKTEARGPRSLRPVDRMKHNRHSYCCSCNRHAVFLETGYDQMSTKIFVGNLNFQATEQELPEFPLLLRSRSGSLHAQGQGNREARGFAFVTFEDDAAAQEALRDLNGKEFAGRPLTVNEARPKEEGGGGGRGFGGGGGGRRDFGGGGGGRSFGGGGGGGRGFGGGGGGRSFGGGGGGAAS